MDLLVVYFEKFKRSTDRDKGSLEVNEAEANEQHKSIISALKVAALEWESDQINFVVGNRGSDVESDFYPKLKTLDVPWQDDKKERTTSSSLITCLSDTGMRSAQSGDCVFSPAGARRCEANHRGIEGEHQAQCASVKR